MSTEETPDNVRELRPESEERQNEADQAQETPDMDKVKAELEEARAELRARSAEVKNLRDKLNQFESKTADIREYVKKMEAEIEDVRSRAKRDQQQQIDQSVSRFFSPFLDIVDSFERSMKSVESENSSFVEGVRLIHKQLEDVLKSSGLERIATVGEKFDPNLHEALSTVPVQDDEQHEMVMEEVKSGYRYKDHIVRVAQVLVGQKA